MGVWENDQCDAKLSYFEHPEVAHFPIAAHSEAFYSSYTITIR